MTDKSKPSRRSDGVLYRRREQLSWPEGRRLRILSIDGGGIRGILPATVLAEFEARHLGGASVGDYFDLIAGTSTGGIIALALSIGIPASKIRDLYIHHGSEIFPSINGPLQRLRRGVRSLYALRHYRYEREPLENALRKIFRAQTFGQANRRLCIPSFDGFTEVNVFKTPHHPDFKIDWKEEIVTVALATSAAPTFFSVYKNGSRQFADGGVWANNPIMIGLVDALTCHAVDRSQIDILSIGCGESEMYITEAQQRLGGVWHWREIISSAMHLASQNAIGQAGLLIGRENLIRIDAPPMPGKAIKLDDVERAANELPAIANELANKFNEVVSQRFLGQRATPYVAYYGPRLATRHPS